MKNQFVFIVITFLISGLLSAQCSAQTQLYITTGFTPPVSDFYESVLSEADKRLPDISINFEILPAERSMILVNQGINDAECCRIPAVVNREYKNLLSVDNSFFSARFSAFGKSNSRQINSFEDLKPFSVGSVEGWKIAVIKVKEVNPDEVHILTTPAQMFQMIEQDRLDYGVVGYLSGLETISKLKLDNIHAIEPPLMEKDLVLVFHKKHKKLIPIFNEIIEQMKNDGTVDKLYNDLIKSLK